MHKQFADTKQRIRQALEYVRHTVDVDWGHEPGHITPLYDLFDAFPVTVHEVEALTYRRAAQFVASQTGHDAIPVPTNEHQPLAGLLYAYKYYDVCRACILIHQDDPVERRRFTAAHELGHYIMHFLPLVIGVSTDSMHIPILLEGLSHTKEEALSEAEDAAEVTVTPQMTAAVPRLSVGQMEREANGFAAALLIPKDACRKLVEVYQPRYANRRSVLARRMATDFLVSRLAMRWRLEDLGLGTP
jgi:IrrE N-terminal-like domain